MDDTILCKFRKRGLEIIFGGYITSSIFLCAMILGNSNYENIYAATWTISICIYHFVKGLYTLFCERIGYLVFLLRYMNFCEYVLFITGNVLLFLIDHDKPKSIEGVGWGIILTFNMCVAFTVLVIFIAMICECCGYDTHLKQIFLNIFEFEIPTLQFVVLFGITRIVSHSKILTEELVPNNFPEYGSTVDNNVVVNVPS